MTAMSEATALGYEPAACLYDVIRKPGIRPSQVPAVDEQGVKIVLDAHGQRVRTKDGRNWRQTGDTALGYSAMTRPETVEEFRTRLGSAVTAENYQRGEVIRLEQDLREHAFDVWQQAKQIREAELAGFAPRNPDACVRFGRTCEFFPACSGDAQLDDPTRYRRSELHPELTQPQETP
jgi:hypothetical protein